MKPQRAISRLLTCLLLVFTCTSCITSHIVSSQRSQINNINRKTVRLTGKTVQMVNRHAALMVTDNNDVVCIVCDFDDYFDGMTIRGRFHRFGTYEYQSSDRTIHYAPIFVWEKDYRKYVLLAEELDAAKTLSEDKKGSKLRSDI